MKLFLLLLLSVSYTTAFSRNYYVNAKTGSSDNRGTSPNRAKKTIQEAADLTRPGDTVFVMNGVYTNEHPTDNVVTVPNSGTRDKYIVYINYPRHKPIIQFNGWAGFLITNGTSYIKIIGFEIIGNNANVSLADALKQPKSCRNRKGDFDPRYNGNGIGINGKSHHIVIAKNIVRDCGGGGIGASHADYITVEDNIVYNNCRYNLFGSSGIAFYQFWNSDNAKGYKNIIRRNKCFNNRSLVPWMKNCQISDGNGIIIDDFRSLQNGSKLGKYKGRTLIENNISWYNGGTGIHTFQSDHVDMINNTAYLNSQSKGLNSGQILSGLGYDVKIVNNIMVANNQIVINSNYSNTNLVYENNLHYNITYPGKEKIAIKTRSCINGLNPLFIKPGITLHSDFRLQKNSPAIGRGNQSIHSETDFTQKPRRKGLPVTIGAYQM